MCVCVCVGGGGGAGGWLRNRLEVSSNWSVTLHLVACNVHAYLLIFTCEGEFTSLSVNFSLWGNATDPWHRKAEFHRFFLMMHESSNQHGQVIGKAALLKNASFLVSLFLCRASRFETHSHLANGSEFNWPLYDVDCALHYSNQDIVGRSLGQPVTEGTWRSNFAECLATMSPLSQLIGTDLHYQ